MDPETIRSQIPAASNFTYLDTAATSPVPKYVIRAMMESLVRRSHLGEGFFDDACRRVDAVRDVVGAHLGVQPSGIAFMKSTGEGINHVARSLPFKAGQNIVTGALEFPTNRLPWAQYGRTGIEVRKAALDDRDMGSTVEAFSEQIDARTALVTLSWVTFNTGYRHDVAEIAKVAKENDALVLVDAIQGEGALAPPDMRDIDFWACGGMKWLMAPFGVGYLYVRPELARVMTPDHLGWWSLADTAEYDADDVQLAPDARRFEIGNLGFDVIEGLGAAVRNLPPMQVVEDRIRDLTGRLIDGLASVATIGTPAAWERRAGIVRVELPDHERVHARLHDAGVRCAMRSGGLRFSPHFWNTPDEVNRVVDLVREMAR